MEVMRRSGVMSALSRLLRPVLGRLFPRASRDVETLDALAANVSANFLGLGNAATPMGIKAAQGMARLSERPGTAGKELCLLVVLNTAPYSCFRPRRLPCARPTARPLPLISCRLCG